MTNEKVNDATMRAANPCPLTPNPEIKFGGTGVWLGGGMLAQHVGSPPGFHLRNKIK